MSGDVTLEFSFKGQRFKDGVRGLEAYAADIGADWARATTVLSPELRTYLDTVAQAM